MLSNVAVANLETENQMKEWLRQSGLPLTAMVGRKTRYGTAYEAVSGTDSCQLQLLNGQQKTNVETGYGHYKSGSSGAYQHAENSNVKSD
jgi:hypothetical protein